MDRIYDAIAEATHFVSIGTSGAVYPAAGFVQVARSAGAHTLELNLQASEGSHYFDHARQGFAGELVPSWVAEVVGGRFT
jgi:NAD-dependent deacetylase